MPSSAIKSFTEPHDFQGAIRGATIKSLISTSSGNYYAELVRIDLHNLWMQHGRTSLPQIFHFLLPNDRAAMHFLADAQQAAAVLNGMVVSADHLICYSPGAEHYFRTTSASHWHAMSLPTAVMAEAGRVLIGCDAVAPMATRLIRIPLHLMSRLRGLHEAAARLAMTAPEVLAHPEVARAMEQELVRVMAVCLADPANAPTFRSSRQQLAVMRRFEQLLEANQDRPLYLTEACAAIGVTDRTLRLHCQEHLGMGPHRYLWLRRMHLARRALALADGKTRTVTEIANDYGFGELGRFAVLYRELFGESPSATLRRPPDDRRTDQGHRFDGLISVRA